VASWKGGGNNKPWTDEETPSWSRKAFPPPRGSSSPNQGHLPYHHRKKKTTKKSSFEDLLAARQTLAEMGLLGPAGPELRGQCPAATGKPSSSPRSQARPGSKRPSSLSSCHQALLWR
jgi:hypothetical protein